MDTSLDIYPELDKLTFINLRCGQEMPNFWASGTEYGWNRVDRSLAIES